MFHKLALALAVVSCACVPDRSAFKCNPATGEDCVSLTDSGTPVDSGSQVDAGADPADAGHQEEVDAGFDGGMEVVDAGPWCGPGNCAGCCVGVSCVLPAEQTPTVCGGSEGAACSSCSTNSLCVVGQCTALDDCSPGDCSVLATCTNTATGHTCKCNAGYTGNGVTCSDTIAPSTSAAVVKDGPGPADSDAQISTVNMQALWSGFTDANGVAAYEYNLSTTAACTGDVIATVNVGINVNGSNSGLALTDRRYFNCVRASDASNNWSPWVASNGITVDHTPPMLEASVPAHGSSGAEPGGFIELTFNEALATTSRLEANFSLTSDGHAVAFTLEWSMGNKRARLAPSTPLAHLKGATVTVAAGVADSLGNATTLPMMVNFTVRDWGWSPSVWVPDANLSFSNKVTVDRLGRVLIVWMLRNKIGASRYTPGQGFEQTQSFTPATGYQSDPAVAMNADGKAVLAWVHSEGSFTNLYASLFDPTAGTWSTPVLVEASLVGVSSPSVFIDAAGTSTVVWSDAALEVWANRTSGATWGTPTKLGAIDFVGNVALGGNAAGDLMAVWGGYTMQTSKLTGGAWGAPVQIQDGHSVSDRRVVAMTDDGTTFVSYFQSNYANYDLYVIRHTAAAGWGGALVMPTVADKCVSYGYSLAVDGLGNAWVTWQQKANGLLDTWGNRFSGGAWGTSQVLVAHTHDSQVVLNPQGSGALVTSTVDQTSYKIELRTLTSGSIASPQVLDALAESDVRMAIGAGGHIAVIYGQPTTRSVSIVMRN